MEYWQCRQRSYSHWPDGGCGAGVGAKEVDSRHLAAFFLAGRQKYIHSHFPQFRVIGE